MAKRGSVKRRSVRGKTRDKALPAARKRRIWRTLGWAAVWLVVALVVITLVTGRFPIRIPALEMPAVQIPSLKIPEPSSITQRLPSRAFLDLVYLVAFSWATGLWVSVIFGWLAESYSPTGDRAHAGYELRDMQSGKRAGRATERQVYEWRHGGAGSWSGKIARGRRRIRLLGLPVAVVAVVLLVTRPGSLLMVGPGGLADYVVFLAASSAVVTIATYLIRMGHERSDLGRRIAMGPDGRPDLRYMSVSLFDFLWVSLPVIQLVAGLVLIVSFCVPAVRSLIGGQMLAISSGVCAVGYLLIWYRERNPLMPKMSKAAKKEEEQYKRMRQAQDPALDELFRKIMDESARRKSDRRR